MNFQEIFVTIQTPNYETDGELRIFDTKIKVAYKPGENLRYIAQALVDRLMKGATVLDAFVPDLEPNMF